MAGPTGHERLVLGLSAHSLTSSSGSPGEHLITAPNLDSCVLRWKATPRFWLRRSRLIGSAAVAAPAFDFDPLIGLDGLWTPELADRYLPIPGMPPAKYECLDGKLITSPREAMFAIWTLGKHLEPAAAECGHLFYLTVNLLLDVQKWIELDFVVLKRSGRGRTWIPPEDVLLAGECVSPSSKQNDHVNKPARCAAVGIPYFMRVEVAYSDGRVNVVLLRLDNGEYRPHSRGSEAEVFETDLPLPLSFNPAELLERLKPRPAGLGGSGRGLGRRPASRVRSVRPRSPSGLRGAPPLPGSPSGLRARRCGCAAAFRC